MPNLVVGLGNYNPVLRGLAVELLVLLGANSANLRIITAKISFGVEKRVDVEAGTGWSSAELAESVDELLLEVVGKVVLSTEENNTALGDYIELDYVVRLWLKWLTCNSQVSNQLVRVRRVQ